MKKRFIICMLLALVIFLAFVLIREQMKDYNILNKQIENYNYIK